MEFTGQLDALQSRVATAKTDVQAAAIESREQLKTRVDKRTREMDAEDAAMDANWAEADAADADAINFAGRAVDSAEVATLDAISARAYAAERAKAAAS
jgi:hypothetical protein